MNILKRIVNFYIFSNIHVGLAVFCLVKITALHYGIKSNVIAFFCIFSTIASYNLIRIFRIKEVQPWFFQFIKNTSLPLIFLTIFSALISFLLIFKFRYETLYGFIPFGLITLFYIIPLGRKGQKLSLRSIPFVKLFLIAILWAGVTVIMPLVQHRIQLGYHELIVFTQRFLFVVVITLPFDIRDIAYDNDELKTLPQVLGIQKSKWLGLLFLVLFLGLTFLNSPIDSAQLRIHFYMTVLVLLFLMRSSENQSEYYSAFYVESLPMVWLALELWLG